MQEPAMESVAGLDRRGFLGLGIATSLILAAAGLSASLSGCSGKLQTAQGLRFLREADVSLLRALLPALLAGLLPADAAARKLQLDATLQRFDSMCARLGIPNQKALRDLFDLLNGALTRRLAAGVAKSWAEVSPAEAEAFLERWRSSSVSLFNAGYRGLNKLASVSYLGLPQTWPLSGYAGPLDYVFRAANT